MVKTRKDLTPRRRSRGPLSRGRPVSCANMKVVVRVRPENSRENGDNFRNVVRVVDESMLMFDPEEDNTPFFYHGVQQKGRDLLKKAHKNMKFSYDAVFSQESTNADVFEQSTKSLIESLMEGCNCSVFVYGATGAGKTFTMLGTKESPGIMFLTMQELYKQKEELADDRDFELAVSYLEIYNENVQDLLKPGGPPLHLREDAKLGVMVSGIFIKRIANPDELFELLERGNKSRTQHPTDANAESSRSHAVFQVYIRMTSKSTGQSLIAKLSMIDLAGSERASATGCKGDRFTEGANINKSLLALGNCINSLADGKRHVPYRDSKLTRVLKDSLGGNCQTVMIANISPSSLSYEDTYNTLKYATRAKKIKANVKKNIISGELNRTQYLKVIEDLKKEILRLKELKKTEIVEVERCKNCESTAIPTAAPIAAVPTPSVCDTTQVIETNDPNYEAVLELKSRYDKYKKTQERYYKLKQNKKLVDIRLDLKEQINNRISVLYEDATDKENVHTKLLHSMERLKKQSDAFNTELEKLREKVAICKRDIDKTVRENIELKEVAAMEDLKLAKMIAEINLEESQSAQNLQKKELETQLNLIQEMQKFLRPWYSILRKSDYVTESMKKDYLKLCSRIQGVCSVTFEDGDSGFGTSSSATSTVTVAEEETRALKRKLPEELDNTFTLSSSHPSTSKLTVDQLLKVLPSPPKKVAKAPFSRVTKPRPLTTPRTPIGTMGTSSRFASISIPSKNTLMRPKFK